MLTWTGDEEAIEIVLLDQAIEVDVGEDLAGVGAPMAEESGLEVLDLERFLEESVLLEEEHAETEVEGCAHVRVGLFEFLRDKGSAFDGRPCGAEGREGLVEVRHVERG